jgi:hypothetical protein
MKERPRRHKEVGVVDEVAGGSLTWTFSAKRGHATGEQFKIKETKRILFVDERKDTYPDLWNERWKNQVGKETRTEK